MLISLILAAVVPWVVVVLPGIFWQRQRDISASARALLWSISLWIVLSFATFWLHLPVVTTPVVVAIVSTVAIWRARRWGWLLPVPHTRASGSSYLLIALLVGGYLLFGFFFWQNHQALPTGDSQKAIVWAERALVLQSLPDYHKATALLNRDPVDFYTPGLHTVTALLLQFSAQPLASVGFFAIVAALSAALVAVAITQVVVPRSAHHWGTYLTAVAVLTNPRFLRYLREPGYHYQNVVGELLLFGLLYVGLRLVVRWRWADALLAVLLFLSLLLGHQFSAFLSIFVLLPVAFALSVQRLRQLGPALWSGRWVSLVLLALSLTMAAGYLLGLHHKLPDIFTLTPHLRHLVVPWYEIPRALGLVWVYGGLLGLWALQYGKDRAQRRVALVFTASSAVIVLLSFGPTVGIDIPPVRTLFYTVIPLSIGLGSFLAQLGSARSAFSHLLTLLLLITLAISSFASLRVALKANHTVRTNSTLNAAVVQLIDELREKVPPGSVVVDDYNRRASTWLLLSGRPTFSRIAADLATQMAEAKQTPLRQALYLNQLDFEKIYALGSLPEVLPLLEKQGIAAAVGVDDGSHRAFSHNPSLQVVGRAASLTLFAPTATSADSLPEDTAGWLRAVSTLANDIGDEEDTFEHLLASLRATRLSPPQAAGSTTWRTTRSPLFVMRFNVGDFVLPLWTKADQSRPDRALEFYWQLVGTVPDLQLFTSTGQRFPLRSHAMIHLNPSDVPIEPDGFVTLAVANEAQREVAIDLIALGLARTP